MIEVKRDDFFVESIKNPIEYGTYYIIRSTQNMEPDFNGRVRFTTISSLQRQI